MGHGIRDGAIFGRSDDRLLCRDQQDIGNTNLVPLVLLSGDTDMGAALRRAGCHQVDLVVKVTRTCRCKSADRLSPTPNHFVRTCTDRTWSHRSRILCVRVRDCGCCWFGWNGTCHLWAYSRDRKIGFETTCLIGASLQYSTRRNQNVCSQDSSD